MSVSDLRFLALRDKLTTRLTGATSTDKPRCRSARATQDSLHNHIHIQIAGWREEAPNFSRLRSAVLVVLASNRKIYVFYVIEPAVGGGCRANGNNEP